MGEAVGSERATIRAELVLPEAIEAGLLGGFAVAIVFFARDVGLGEPLHTASVLGTLLLSGVEAAREVRSAPGVAAAYHIIHFAAWMVAGLVGSVLMTLAEREPRWRVLPLLGLVAWVACFAVLDGWVAHTELGRPHLWAGGLAGVLACAAFLSWRHPGVLSRAGGDGT